MSSRRRVISRTAGACFALGIMWAWSVSTMGQTPAESPLVYHTWESFTTRDGLPHNSIWAVRVVDDRVWVGTEGGLAMYDGRTWKSWTQEDGFPSPIVTAIDVDTRTDELWIGTWGGGLVRFSAGRIDRFNQRNSGIAGDLVFAVRVAGGRIWAATSAGLSSFDPLGDMWKLHFPRRADPPEIVVTNLTVAGDNLYAAGWGMHVRRFDLGRNAWSLVAGPGCGQQASPTGPQPFLRGGALGIASVGQSLWLLTQDQLCHRHGTLGWEAQSLSALPDAGNFFRCLAVRGETEAWVGTHDGLRSLADFSADTWVTYRRCENDDVGLVALERKGQTVAAQVVTSTIPDNRIRCIAFDRDDIWVGTVNGLARGVEWRRWRDLSARAEGAKTSCPRPGATPPPMHEARSESPLPEAVTIGVLGPIVRPIALPGGDPRKITDVDRANPLAVQLAVDEANARGGYRGRIPFRLATGTGEYENYGWGTPEDDFARFRHKDHAVGIVAYLGPGYHVRSAVAFRTEVPVVNVSGLPPGTEERANPWVFRCPGDDPRLHEHVVDFIVEQTGRTRLAVLRTPGVLERRHQDLWVRSVRQRHPTAGLVAKVDYNRDTDNLDSVLRVLEDARAEAVLTWCDISLSALVLRRMRELGMEQLFVGGEQIACDEFLKVAGYDSGPAVAPYPCPHRENREALARFAERYIIQDTSTRMKGSPPPEAYLTFHATSHLLQTLDLAGLDRDAVRQMLVRMSDIRLAVLEKGRWKSVTLPAR